MESASFTNGIARACDGSNARRTLANGAIKIRKDNGIPQHTKICQDKRQDPVNDVLPFIGNPLGARTQDPHIKSVMLYQLS